MFLEDYKWSLSILLDSAPKKIISIWSINDIPDVSLQDVLALDLYYSGRHQISGYQYQISGYQFRPETSPNKFKIIGRSQEKIYHLDQNLRTLLQEYINVY